MANVIEEGYSYTILDNTLTQTPIVFVDNLDNETITKLISVSSDSITMKRNLLTSVIETKIDALGITDVNTGNTINMDKLTFLPTGLASLEAPPDNTTLNINHTLLATTTTTPTTYTSINGIIPSITLTDGTNTTTITKTSITNTGNIELVPNDVTGDLVLTGTNLESAISGTASGNYLRIKLNGTYYKIELKNDN
jgi:hypothetical protein